MKERPILFSGEMVRAILEGRKTQTRWVMKPQPDHFAMPCYTRPNGKLKFEDGTEITPYGHPEDRLWVRHAWYHNKSERNPKNEQAWDEYTRCVRWADKEVSNIKDCQPNVENLAVWRKRPSIHMPRWASLILLEIVSVRVEWLQDISEKDAMAEGVRCNCVSSPCDGSCRNLEWKHYLKPEFADSDPVFTARESFQTLWDSINVDRGFGWNTNPWVWVIEFKGIAA